MENFRIAVKACVINDKGEMLLIKRRSNDPHSPGVWEIPGGRLDVGENPFFGLQREIKEEVGLDIEVLNPLMIHHFTRDDEQKITMITFLCKAISSEVVLSEEHTNYEWRTLSEAPKLLTKEFHEEVNIIKTRFKDIL